MNHIYRLTWNESQQQFVAAPETSRGRHKGGRTRRKLIAAAVASAMIGGAAMAAPTGGQVASGSATIAPNGTALTVNQSSQKLVMNWQSFSIAGNETVNFVQPGASAVALNRVLGSDPSAIYGHLNANGQVFLVNPNGILFGKDAQVNVGGLVASTLDLSDADFLAGQRTFRAGSGAAGVGNAGRIVADGGYIAFLGGKVSNQGTLQANLGTVALAAGEQATLDFAGDKLINVQIDRGALNALAENGQLIEANGGSVILTAKAAGDLVAAVVNNTGVITARTMREHDGVITLLGDMRHGQVHVGGTLDASAPNGGNGGFIETSAARVVVDDAARVTTAAADGNHGRWLIDPNDYTVAASGGDITGATLSNNLGTTSVILQSSSGAAAGSGNVNVNDAVAWNANTTLTLTATNNVHVNAPVTATGSAAGLAINPNTANGADAASGTGRFVLGPGGVINLPNVSPASKSALVIGGKTYSVINSLGSAADLSGTTLQGIDGNTTGYYALGSNIDASATAAWNGNAGFAPLGRTAGFTGVFDGLGHTISGLTIKTPSSAAVGLFGTVGANGTVRNVGLVGASVSGGPTGVSVGALAGINNGALANVYSTAAVTGPNTSGGQAGGLVGYNKGSISNAYVEGRVNGAGSATVGGLTGQNDGTLDHAFATGSVTGGSNSEVGGLAGENKGTIANAYAAATGGVWGSNDAGGLVGVNFGSIRNAYATGDIFGISRIGGLVGTNAGTIVNAYATGNVSGNGSSLGGLVGSNNVNGSVSTVYATGSVTGASPDGTGAGGLAGSNKGTISAGYWNVDAAPTGIGSTGPDGTATNVAGLTKAQMRTAANFAGFTFSSSSGGDWVVLDSDGTLNNAAGADGGTTPMLASEWSETVMNAHQLQLMALRPSGSYVLGRNIDASATATGTDVWSSGGFIPVGTAASPASVSFDGTSHAISGLTINAPSRDRVGLFATLSGPVVIQNLGLKDANITGGSYVGALAGENLAGEIRNVYASGTADGNAAVGALVGANTGGVIANAYATATVNAGSQAGGLIGVNGGTITNVYGAGRVRGTTEVGGLAGTNSGTIGNAFWNSDINPTAIGTSTGTASASGLTGAQMQTQASFVSANPAWDFRSTWIMYDGYTAPLLRSFMTPLTVTANDLVKTYDGKALSVNGRTFTYSTRPDGRLLGTASIGGSAGGAINVGTYTIKPEGLYSTDQQGYAINAVDGTLQVNPKQLTMAGVVIENKTYDGSTAALLKSGHLVGDVPGDNVFLLLSANFATKDVGVGIAVTTNYTLGGSSAGNYTLIQPTGLFANITPRQLTVSGTTVASKTYDGTTAAPLTAGTLNGVLNGDTVTLTQAGVFATKNAGTGIAVTAKDSLGGAAAGNYTLLQPTGLFGTIEAKKLTVTGITVADKAYDGTTKATISGGTLNGLVDGDNPTLTKTGAFATKNAGNAVPVTITGKLGGTGAGNYELVLPTSLTANINPKQLKTPVPVAANKVYDGTTAATLKVGKLTGVLPGDSVTLVQIGQFMDKNVANRKPVSYTSSLTGSDSSNYLLAPYMTTVKANITPRPLTLAGMTVAADKAYDGTTVALVSGGVIDGVLGSDVVALAQKGTFSTKAVGVGKTVLYTNSLGGADAGNYTLGLNDRKGTTTASITAP